MGEALDNRMLQVAKVESIWNGWSMLLLHTTTLPTRHWIREPRYQISQQEHQNANNVPLRCNTIPAVFRHQPSVGQLLVGGVPICHQSDLGIRFSQVGLLPRQKPLEAGFFKHLLAGKVFRRCKGRHNL